MLGTCLVKADTPCSRLKAECSAQGFAHKPAEARGRAATPLCCLALLAGELGPARLWADAALAAFPGSPAASVNKARPNMSCISCIACRLLGWLRIRLEHK